MKFKLIIDENVDNRIFREVNTINYEIIFISREHTGITDLEVIQLAEKHNAVVITEDKDFGEWVFSHKRKIGVIFLRYSSKDLDKIKNALFNTLEKYGHHINNFFTVISVDKLRMRSL